MHAINIHEAKTRFLQLMEAAMRGEEIIIAKAGKPAARLIPYISKTKRKIGLYKGQIRISDDFDAPLD